MHRKLWEWIALSMFDINSCSSAAYRTLLKSLLLMVYVYFFVLEMLGGNMSTDHHEDSINEADKYGGKENGASYDDHLIPAERRFLQQTQKLELQRLAKMASRSHRDRIQEFNQYLANLSEHYDIPKVGPG
ncbi:FAM32A protein [Spatholobus suberectus]|nr:FAM32A protein [Spatholobus suberectus]